MVAHTCNLALGRLRQEEAKFQASLGNTEKSCLQINCGGGEHKTLISFLEEQPDGEEGQEGGYISCLPQCCDQISGKEHFRKTDLLWLTA